MKKIVGIAIVILLSSSCSQLKRSLRKIDKAKKDNPELFEAVIDTFYISQLDTIKVPEISLDTSLYTSVDSVEVTKNGIKTFVRLTIIDTVYKWDIKTVVQERFIFKIDTFTQIVYERESCKPVVVYKVPLWSWVYMSSATLIILIGGYFVIRDIFDRK